MAERVCDRVSLVGRPVHGTLKLKANGSFVYKSRVNFKGTDRFTYEVRSGSLVSNVATVTLTVVSPPKKGRPKLQVETRSTPSRKRTHAVVAQAIAHFGVQARSIRASKIVEDALANSRGLGSVVDLMPSRTPGGARRSARG